MKLLGYYIPPNGKGTSPFFNRSTNSQPGRTKESRSSTLYNQIQFNRPVGRITGELRIAGSAATTMGTEGVTSHKNNKNVYKIKKIVHSIPMLSMVALERYHRAALDLWG